VSVIPLFAGGPTAGGAGFIFVRRPNVYIFDPV
jgi:hypothetical protein